MGTYGTTHIIKDKKKIDLTDSHDGYFSFMGRTNLLSIKYISDKNLDRLFKSYTAKADEDTQITDRDLKDAIFQVEQDSKNDEMAIEWIKQSLSDSVRASVTGFGPLLYLNKNPGFSDSETPNYIIDLNAKEFIYTRSEHAVFKLSFDTIRKTPENVLNYLGNELGNDFELIKGSIYSELESQFDELAEEDLSKTEIKKLKSLQLKIQAEIDTVLKIDSEVISQHDKKQEDERIQHLKRYDEPAKLVDDDAEHGGFSIRSANGVSMPNLRKVIFFVQKYMAINPDAKFLLECADWGINEDGATAGFRFFSPKKEKYCELYEKIINTIEYQFKIGMNGFSSSGSYSSNGAIDNDKEDNFSIFGDDVQGPEKSLYSLAEARLLSPEWENLILEANPHMIYYINYNEAREIALLNELGHPNSSIPWTYAALLNQDQELFEKMYSKVQKLNLTQSDKDKVFPSLLQSFSDSEQINKLLGLEDNLDFMKTVQNSGFFEDTKEKMTKSEQSKYLAVKPKKMKK